MFVYMYAYVKHLNVAPPPLPTRSCYTVEACGVCLMNVRIDVVPLSRLCNEPCMAAITLGLIDYKQRSFTCRGAAFEQCH